MDILLVGLLAGLVAAAVAVAVVMLVQRPRAVQAGGLAVSAPEARAPAEPKMAGRKDGLEEELVARRTEIARQEERLHARESSLEALSQQLV